MQPIAANVGETVSTKWKGPATLVKPTNQLIGGIGSGGIVAVSQGSTTFKVKFKVAGAGVVWGYPDKVAVTAMGQVAASDLSEV